MMQGEALLKTEDPLGEACKLVATLRAHAGHLLETHLWACKVILRMPPTLRQVQGWTCLVRPAGTSCSTQVVQGSMLLHTSSAQPC